MEPWLNIRGLQVSLNNKKQSYHLNNLQSVCDKLGLIKPITEQP